jgi:hypothetical protein
MPEAAVVAATAQIMASSSSSWWAAWLSGYEGKQVTAPKKWFLAEGINDADLVPADWTRI